MRSAQRARIARLTRITTSPGNRQEIRHEASL
jgi:hypothetical protein